MAARNSLGLPYTLQQWWNQAQEDVSLTLRKENWLLGMLQFFSHSWVCFLIHFPSGKSNSMWISRFFLRPFQALLGLAFFFFFNEANEFTWTKWVPNWKNIQHLPQGWRPYALLQNDITSQVSQLSLSTTGNVLVFSSHCHFWSISTDLLKLNVEDANS